LCICERHSNEEKQHFLLSFVFTVQRKCKLRPTYPVKYRSHRIPSETKTDINVPTLAPFILVR
jgi:hypothetical protein